MYNSSPGKHPISMSFVFMALSAILLMIACSPGFSSDNKGVHNVLYKDRQTTSLIKYPNNGIMKLGYEP